MINIIYKYAFYVIYVTCANCAFYASCLNAIGCPESTEARKHSLHANLLQRIKPPQTPPTVFTKWRNTQMSKEFHRIRTTMFPQPITCWLIDESNDYEIKEVRVYAMQQVVTEYQDEAEGRCSEATLAELANEFPTFFLILSHGVEWHPQYECYFEQAIALEEQALFRKEAREIKARKVTSA